MIFRLLSVVFCVFIMITASGCASSKNISSNTSCTIDKQIVEDVDNQISLPSAYYETIKDYKAVIDFRLSNTFEADYNNGKTIVLSKQLNDDISKASKEESDLGYKWSNMLVEMVNGLQNPKKESFGYVLLDINYDNTPELFWVREDYVILAMFTIHNNEARLLDAFWPQYMGVITDHGEIYTKTSGGAAYCYYELSRLAANSCEINSVKQFGIDGVLYVDGNPSGENYYEGINNTRSTVDRARFVELLATYPFQLGSQWDNLPIMFF